MTSHNDWQVSVSQSGNIVRELAKMATLKDAEGGKDGAKSAKKGKKGKEEVCHLEMEW